MGFPLTSGFRSVMGTLLSGIQWPGKTADVLETNLVV
jgi:hypothetical protein